MADLRTKIFGLAGALLCTGMAYGAAAGPAACTGGTAQAPTATTVVIRAEGTTEQLAPVTFTCVYGAVGTGTATPDSAGINLQVFLSPAVPVTSKVLSTTTGATEATLTVTSSAAGATPRVIQGTASGSTINFSGVVASCTAVPAVTPCPVGNQVPPSAGDVLTFTITNVRVNATSLSVGTGLPPSISETPFISGAAVTPAALASVTTGFAQNGLSATTLNKSIAGFPTGAIGTSSGANNFVICNGFSPKISLAGSLVAAVVVKENFASAFKTAGTVGTASPSVEASQTAVTGNGTNSATRFALNFANVPSNVTLYVPSGTIVSQGTSVATVALSAGAPGGPFVAVPASTVSAVGGNALAPVTVAGGTGSAVFEVTAADATNLDQFNIPVYIVTTANTVPGSSTAMTINVSFSPVGSTAIPNFAVGASTTTLTASTFNLCTTSLLFPFVTNQLGFDTGIAISNTSTDPFGTLGATPQSGTCTLNFYGNGTPTPNNTTTANIPTGTVYSAPLSSVAAGFQGYIIAQCTFQFAHGFAFLTDGVGPNGGLSQGYLAGVIPDVNQGARGANPVGCNSSNGSACPVGTGETLGN